MIEKVYDSHLELILKFLMFSGPFCYDESIRKEIYEYFRRFCNPKFENQKKKNTKSGLVPMSRFCGFISGIPCHT